MSLSNSVVSLEELNKSISTHPKKLTTTDKMSSIFYADDIIDLVIGNVAQI